MAFPALGLSKIIWATDVILAMKLPEFDVQALKGTGPSWHDVAAVRELPAGEVHRIDIEGRGLLAYREGRTVQVYDSRCPHRSTDIPELAMEGATLTCPRHGWAFDGRSGDCIRKGDTQLKRLPAKVVKGRLLVSW